MRTDERGEGWPVASTRQCHQTDQLRRIIVDHTYLYTGSDPKVPIDFRAVDFVDQRVRKVKR